MVEVAKWSRPGGLGVDDAEEQAAQQNRHLPCLTYGVRAARGFLHRLSTVSTTSGITFRPCIATSWISPLWPMGAGGYISSRPKGQVRTAGTAPGSDPRGGQGVGPR